jgi:SAM-dependent methyltransferase
VDGVADDYRRTSLDMWQRMASGWERRQSDIDRSTASVREWLLAELAPKAGDTILELAAGPGETGFAAASLVGPSGRVISTDFAPEMVEVARRRAAAIGLDNVELRVLDAEALDLEDDSVDGIVCRFGFMLMADRDAAFREARRVLRAGGRLGLAVWTVPEENPWLSIAGRVLVERGHMPPPEPGSPGVFSLGTTERVRDALESAGFSSVKVETVGVQFRYGDVDEYVASAMDTGGSFSNAFETSSAEERAEMIRQFEAGFSPFLVEGRYELPGRALVAVAS